MIFYLERTGNLPEEIFLSCFTAKDQNEIRQCHRHQKNNRMLWSAILDQIWMNKEQNLDISHSDLAFKSIQDFLRVKWVKQRLIWSMIYNRPSFSLFRWIKIWVVAFQLFTFPLFIDRTGKTQEKYWAKILRQENTVKNLALRRADSP